MKLKGVKVIDKPERGRHENRDVNEKSSKVSVYNIFNQSWTDLQAEGLAHLFNNDQAEFERKRAAATQNQ